MSSQTPGQIEGRTVINPKANKASHANNFDSLRLFFAVLVILSHSFPLSLGSNDSEPLSLLTHGQITFGNISVWAFFVISGFLITQSWQRSPKVGKFLKRRVGRIYPGFIVAALLSWLIVIPVAANPSEYFPMSWQSVVLDTLRLRNLETPHLFVNNPVRWALNGSLWSVQYEFWCYLGILVLGLTGQLRRRWVVGTLFALVIGLHLAMEVFHWAPSGNILGQIFGYPPIWATVLPFYLAGTLFYLYGGQALLKARWIGVAAVVLVISNFVPHGFIVTMPIFGAYLLMALAYVPWLHPLNLARFGDFSYGTYLYAFPIQQLLVMRAHGQISPWLLFAEAAPLTLIAGALSWYLVEKHFLMRSSQLRHEGVSLTAGNVRDRSGVTVTSSVADISNNGLHLVASKNQLATSKAESRAENSVSRHGVEDRLTMTSVETSPLPVAYRRVFMVISPGAVVYAHYSLESLFRNSAEPLHLHLVTDSLEDKHKLVEELSLRQDTTGHQWSVFAEDELADQEADIFGPYPNLRFFRHGHPCWRKITDPVLLTEGVGNGAEEMVLLDPDLYFPNRFCFEPTPATGVLLMWQRPSCLVPPATVRKAMAQGIRFAHHVDIGVGGWRAAVDLEWMEWLLGRIDVRTAPRVMHIEAIVWAALAMHIGGGYLDPALWHCWYRNQPKRILRKMGLPGIHLLRVEEFDKIKCFHAGGEAKWWLAEAKQRGWLDQEKDLTKGGPILPFEELVPDTYYREQKVKQALARMGYYSLFRT